MQLLEHAISFINTVMYTPTTPATPTTLEPEHALSFIRVCLIAITFAGERLRRSPDLLHFVENALRAFSTKCNKLFARRSRARPRRARAKALRIRHVLI